MCLCAVVLVATKGKTKGTQKAREEDTGRGAKVSLLISAADQHVVPNMFMLDCFWIVCA